MPRVTPYEGAACITPAQIMADFVRRDFHAHKTHENSRNDHRFLNECVVVLNQLCTGGPEHRLRGRGRPEWPLHLVE